MFETVNLTTLHFGIGLDDYDNHRTLMNTVSSAWEYCVLGQYRPGFDVLAPGVDCGGDEVLRCPVLYEEDSEGGPALQVDVVHTPAGALLEFQSTKGREFLQQVADSVEVEVEFWDGPPHLRWDGKGSA
jgi:hypothetical protein